MAKNQEFSTVLLRCLTGLDRGRAPEDHLPMLASLNIFEPNASKSARILLQYRFPSGQPPS
jgi:hypothetical protein